MAKHNKIEITDTLRANDLESVFIRYKCNPHWELTAFPESCLVQTQPRKASDTATLRSRSLIVSSRCQLFGSLQEKYEQITQILGETPKNVEMSSRNKKSNTYRTHMQLFYETKMIFNCLLRLAAFFLLGLTTKETQNATDENYDH